MRKEAIPREESILKASVITLHTVDNYGSVMQTYATQQILQKWGCDVEFVDYWRKDNLPRERAEQLLHKSSTMQKLKPIWNVNGITCEAAVAVLEKAVVGRKSPMWKFLEKYVTLTPKRYSSLEELQKDPPRADVYITGSDQVWNSIWNQGIDRAYFLEYAPEGKPRIAFSASIGRETLDEEEIPETRELLEKYSAISVREESAVRLLASLGIQSTWILDPTLMLSGDEWRKIAAKVSRRQPYLLLYQLNPNPEMDAYAVQLAQKQGWELVRIGFGRSDSKKLGTCIMLPSVEEFLGLFDQAACVLTDSFHATAFSLNLDKEFISVLPNRFGTRIESIAKLTKTEQRILRNFQKYDIVNSEINHQRVQDILHKERTSGLKWLENQIKKEF